jgi:hypothetical protein
MSKISESISSLEMDQQQQNEKIHELKGVKSSYHHMYQQLPIKNRKKKVVHI